MDADGVDHDWRAELADTLVEAQQPDGSWVNEESRWLEGNAELATIYAVLTLQETLKPPPMR
jgi:squalene-hopene/tetraprenyl-beta-curcumene cyclase